jgi:hypothetical protein
MRKPASMKALEELGRVRLSESFFMRDFLHSEIADFYGIPNIPDDPDLAIEAGRGLSENCLQPLQARFGRISIRSAYRAPAVNDYGNKHKLNCGSNESNYAAHIWDRRDAEGRIGACATVIVNAFIPYYERTGHWEALAWWVHDHLPYDDLEFFPKYAAFNLGWKDAPSGGIYSYSPPRRGWLVKRDSPEFAKNHSDEYAAWLSTLPSPRRGG